MKCDFQRRHLKLDSYLTQLLNSPRPQRASITDKPNRLPVPFKIRIVQGVFKDSRISMIILRSDDDIAVCFSYFLNPFAHQRIRIFTFNSRWSQRLIIKRQRPIAKIEKLNLQSFSFLRLFKQPLSGFFTETIL